MHLKRNENENIENESDTFQDTNRRDNHKIDHQNQFI